MRRSLPQARNVGRDVLHLEGAARVTVCGKAAITRSFAASAQDIDLLRPRQPADSQALKRSVSSPSRSTQKS